MADRGGKIPRKTNAFFAYLFSFRRMRNAAASTEPTRQLLPQGSPAGTHRSFLSLFSLSFFGSRHHAFPCAANLFQRVCLKNRIRLKTGSCVPCSSLSSMRRSSFLFPVLYGPAQSIPHSKGVREFSRYGQAARRNAACHFRKMTLCHHPNQAVSGMFKSENMIRRPSVRKSSDSERQSISIGNRQNSVSDAGSIRFSVHRDA